jgi:membrane protein DedA with SNARE-associated domain
VITQLLLIAASTLASEDLACIAAGTLIAQGRLNPIEGIAACAAGIFAGDLLLFLCGRLFGGRFVRGESVRRASEWLARRGLIVVLLSRFTPGLRLPVYLASGILRVPAWRFAFFLLIACLLWAPLLVGASAVAGERLISGILGNHPGGVAATAAAAGLLAGMLQAMKAVCGKERRRRIAGFILRMVRWEFWPPWAAYLPLIPHLIWLAVKHRSLTVFTAANPGMFSGGFIGESKSEILCKLDNAAAHALLPASLTLEQRIEAARQFGAVFPMVLKPDRGERGRGVAIVRSWAEVEGYLRESADDVIIQRYVPGQEFGVFYYRLPGEPAGRIFSITGKRFPVVTGDGRSTVWDLILDDPRAVAIAPVYRRLSKVPMDLVPASGERVQLVEIGSHCRGAIFLDGSRLLTPELEREIDRIARSHDGFYFGRFDLRVPSADALAAGRDITLIELNGVSAEATHIYDPGVSLREAYRVMRRQWSLAFEIGARNRALGAMPMKLRELLRLLLRSGERTPKAAPRPERSLAGATRTG